MAQTTHMTDDSALANGENLRFFTCGDGTDSSVDSLEDTVVDMTDDSASANAANFVGSEASTNRDSSVCFRFREVASILGIKFSASDAVAVSPKPMNASHLSGSVDSSLATCSRIESESKEASRDEVRRAGRRTIGASVALGDGDGDSSRGCRSAIIHSSRPLESRTPELPQFPFQ